MKNNNQPALGQKENAKHGEVFFSRSEIYNKTCSRLPCHHYTLAR